MLIMKFATLVLLTLATSVNSTLSSLLDEDRIFHTRSRKSSKKLYICQASRSKTRSRKKENWTFKTKKIAEKAWPSYREKGAILGQCVDLCPNLCLGTSGNAPVIPNTDPLECFLQCQEGSEGVAFQEDGDTQQISVLSCNRTNVIVDGKAAATVFPGSFLIYTPGSETSLCSNCSPLFRKVTAVANAGTSPTAKILTTSFATFSDIFSESLLTDKSLGSIEIEPSFECAHSTGRRLSESNGSPENPTSPLLRSFPSTCTGWRQKNSGGRCVYTDCFVGTNGSPNDCFSCGTTCGNGCGGDGGISFSGDFLQFDFGEACCIHDYCYSSTFSKSTCDVNFFIDMMESCPWARKVLKLISLPIVNFVGSSCEFTAAAFYAFVGLGGGSFQQAAQIEQYNYELTDSKCIAKCPSTQTSGGQGITRLVIDMLRTSGTFPISYEMYKNPDELTITYEGRQIFGTGGLVSGSSKADVFFSGTTSIIEVTINAPNEGTEWTVDIGCPYN